MSHFFIVTKNCYKQNCTVGRCRRNLISDHTWPYLYGWPLPRRELHLHPCTPAKVRVCASAIMQSLDIGPTYTSGRRLRS